MTFDKECEQRGRKVTKDERYHGQDGEKIVAIQVWSTVAFFTICRNKLTTLKKRVHIF